MTVVDDLITWLKAQLDDDERVALAADPKRHRAIVTQSMTGQSGAHHNTRLVAEWDPARVLAEIHAKRLILDVHAPVDGYDPNGSVCSTCGERGNPGDEDAVVRWPCLTVRLLAQPYAGREGWLESWTI